MPLGSSTGTQTRFCFDLQPMLSPLEGTAGDVGSEDLVLDNAVIAITQQVTISTFTYTVGAGG